MGYFALLALLLLPAERVATYTTPITALAWTRDHNLLIVTMPKVYEWPTGRSGDLPTITDDGGPPFTITDFSLNASKTKGLGPGFVLDLRTLKAKPYTIRSDAYSAIASWEGDRIVEMHSDGGVFTFVREGRRTRVAPGWYVLGVSADHRYALASHEAPRWEDSTYLLRLDPNTGSAKRLKRFPRSSNDHVMLNVVESNPTTGKLLLHTTDVASDFTSPYFSATPLRELRLPQAEDVLNTSCRMNWIEGSDVWLTVRRQFFHERIGPSGENLGFDASTLDLWNYKTGRKIRVAKAVFNWGPGRNDPDGRGTGDSIGPSVVDWLGRRIAWVVNGPKGGEVFVRKLLP